MTVASQVQAPEPRTDQEPRCWRCRAKLAEFVSRPWRFTCTRCKAVNASPPAE